MEYWSRSKCLLTGRAGLRIAAYISRLSAASRCLRWCLIMITFLSLSAA
jgi:hypothetical protein